MLNNTLKKNTIAFLIILIIVSSGISLFYPQKSSALVAVTDAAHTEATVAGWRAYTAVEARKVVKEVKLSAWKIGLATFRKTLTDKIVNDIVVWIQGGGKPKFVSDWKSYLKEAGDRGGAAVLNELIGDDLMGALCEPNWAIQLNLILRAPQTFKQESMCTLSDIGANYTDFMEDFHKGGLAALIKITESQNNPYGLFIQVKNKQLEAATKAEEAASARASSGAGFLGDRVCKQQTCIGGETFTGTWKEEELSWDCECDKWETRSPGKIVADTLGFSVRKDMEWLISNEEWESYVIAITDALIKRMVTEGVTYLTADDVSGTTEGAYAPDSPDIDFTPPISTASAFDAWHVQITADQTAFIYYTTDGSEPNSMSALYQKPIEITTAATLKWFSVNELGYREEINTEYFYPPLETVLSTAIAAVDSNSLALVSNMATGTAIYHTTDETTPTATPEYYYIKKIEVSMPTIIKWFGKTQDEPEEEIQTAIVSPPFPNDDFPEIMDLVTPEASIGTLLPPAKNQFFPLDASASLDNDSTPQIVMYEWDFDNNGEYDWWIVDYDRDGVFDAHKCADETLLCTVAALIGDGFKEMSFVPGDERADLIQAMYNTTGFKTIGLRVTDNEGLYASATVTTYVTE